MTDNPYPETLTDEVSGTEVPNQDHFTWAEGYQAAKRDDLALYEALLMALGSMMALGINDKSWGGEIVAPILKAIENWLKEG